MTTALVTGANKGIGLEIARGLGALGWRVGVGARNDEARDAAVQKLAAEGHDVFGVPLDVTSDSSVAAAVPLFDELDVLVNNAGITGGMPQDPTSGPFDTISTVIDTNVFGPMRTINAFLPLLRASAHPRIVNVSSGVGSLARQRSGDAGPIAAAYSPSKTFLNAITLQYVRELEGSGILINLVCPGYVATDLNGFRGVRTPEQGAAIAVKIAQIPDDGPTGGYFEDAGTIPW